MKNSFAIGSLGFIAGVFIHSFFSINIFASLFILFISVSLLLYFFFIVKSSGVDSHKTVSPFVPFFLFLSVFSLGLLRYDLSESGKNDAVIENYLNQKVTLTGIIADEPDERENNTRLVVDFDTLAEGERTDATRGRALVTTERFPRYQYGDRILVSGKLLKPQNFESEDGREFDYVSYLAKEGIYYEVRYAQVELVSGGNGNYIKEKLFLLKNSFLEKIRQKISQPQSSLLGGLLVGAKQSLGKSLESEFRRAGVIHVVVLSGYNITIVALAVIQFFSFLPRTIGISFGVFSIILFAIMTGGTATIVRASIMALLVILAKALRRNYDITRALILAGVIMVLHNPKILVFDTSFQLSFLATLALIYFSPIIEPRFKWVPEKYKLRETLIATVSTQILVLPFLLYKIGDVSLVALPVNLLVLFFIPATMFFGFLTGILSYLSSILAFPFAFIAYTLLSYELAVVHFFSSLSFASFHVNSFTISLAVACYCVFAYFIYKNQQKKDKGPTLGD